MKKHDFWNNIEMKSENCYVAFLDIQGFKNYILSHTLEEVELLYETIFDQLDGMRSEPMWLDENDYQLRKYNTLARKAYIQVMSDSIIIAIDKKHRGALQFIFENCARIQKRLLLDHNIMIRGGISMGSFCGTERVAYGRGLVNAYLIEEAEWNKHFRVVLDPAIYRFLKGKHYYCLTEDVSFIDNKRSIRMVDYFEGLMWRIDDYLLAYEFADMQYNIAIEKENDALARKYHWLSLQLVYAEHHLEKREREAEEEQKERWLMARMNLK